MRSRTTAAALVAVIVALAVPATATPAGAAARVSAVNPQGSTAIDPTYTTTLTLRGSGFQSIRKGHGGIYVLFAAVDGQWRPSKGGKSGENYLSVPDSESKANSGFAKFVAFPGSDTAGSANGGTIAANGTWSTTINVPGATFRAVDRDGKVRSVDCRTDTCGVLTIGAHGVVNAKNESFTRVTVRDLYADGQEPAVVETPAAGAGSGPATTGAVAPSSGGAAAPVVAGPATLEVDRASARAGRALAFSASGLLPGSQVSATFEDGEAAVGPLTVGATGQVAGVLALPAGLGTGTYELRLIGEGDLPSVRFAVAANPAGAVDEDERLPFVFAGLGAIAVVAASIAAVLVRRKRARRA